MKKLIFFFFLFSSCQSLNHSSLSSTKSKAKKSSPSVEKTWTQIESQTQLPIAQRLQQIDQFIQTYQKEEIALLAYFLKARLYLKENKQQKACEVYHEATQSLVIYTSSLEIYQKSAECYLKNRQWKKAFDVLESFSQSSKVPKPDREKARLIQWSFIKKNKLAQKQQLIVLSSLFELSKDIQWKQKGMALIDKLSLKEQLEYKKEQKRLRALVFYLDYHIGNHFFKMKKFDLAQTYFKQVLKSSQSHLFEQELKNKILLINKTDQINPFLIGVILPLSGERKVLGEKILRGLSFGFSKEGDQRGQAIQIIIKDSKNHPDTVSSHIDNLFYRHHVVALIGGLSSEVAEVMAKKAEKFSLPTVLFSQSQGISLNRRFVFQNALSPDQLLSPLIKELRGSLKINKVAIMYPDDSYGEKYQDFFEESFMKSGGKVTKKVKYKLGEFDFKDEVKELLHLKRKGREKEFDLAKKKFLEENKTLSGRSKKLIPENILSPKQNFNALFIPDSLLARDKIKDYLKYFGIEDIYLVGLNLWNRDSMKGKDFPLLFVDIEDKNKSQSSFYRSFFKSYGQAPGYFEQKAYNSAVFIKQPIASKVKSRLLLQESLEKTRSFQGAYNTIALSKDRVFQYPIKLYKNKLKKK